MAGISLVSGRCREVQIDVQRDRAGLDPDPAHACAFVPGSSTTSGNSSRSSGLFRHASKPRPRVPPRTARGTSAERRRERSSPSLRSVRPSPSWRPRPVLGTSTGVTASARPLGIEWAMHALWPRRHGMIARISAVSTSSSTARTDGGTWHCVPGNTPRQVPRYYPDPSQNWRQCAALRHPSLAIRLASNKICGAGVVREKI